MSPHSLLFPAGVIFILHQLSQKVWQISIPLADQYLDPLLCMPILLGIWQLEQFYLFNRRINNVQIWIVTTLLALLFEIGFPRFSPLFTADGKDAALYFIGTEFFVMWNPKKRTETV